MIIVHPIGKPLANGVGIGSEAVTGKAKVITGENIDEFEKGDILVVKTLNPDICKVLEKAAGIITEEGGLSSEGAIAGLHYGIPVIVGVENALAVVEHGQTVSLDPKQGTLYSGHVKMM